MSGPQSNPLIEEMAQQSPAGEGMLDGERAMMESLIAFKRAGASGVLSYFAPRVAERLKQSAP